MSIIGALFLYQQNPYHIKTEDDGPHGNDETRCFLLTNLSTQKVTSVACVVCQLVLYVYDKYPLIDGTFFLSPQRYNTDLQVVFEQRLLYLNAVCMRYADFNKLCSKQEFFSSCQPVISVSQCHVAGWCPPLFYQPIKLFKIEYKDILYY